MLYPHQVTGADWLAERKRAALCDDPGLGKTITAIRAADQIGARRVVCIVPSCVLYNWATEFGNWSPARFVQLLDTGTARIDARADVLVTTHTLLLNARLRAALCGWADGTATTVLDEAHFFRGRDAKRADAFYGELVPASACAWAMTGTPMPNNAADLWRMCAGLWPETFPESFEAFRERFCVTAWTRYGDNVKVVGNRNAPELRARLEGRVLRRRKDAVLDLPPVRFEQIALRPTRMPTDVEELQGQLRRKVLDAVAKAQAEGATEAQALEIIGEHEEFSRFRRLCGLAKVQPCVELLRMEIESGALPKVVVFAHHADVVEGLAVSLHDLGVVTITGATSPRERADAVRRFQNDPAVRVIVCNVLAGGTGTTLTAAADIVFVELSPVPGENAQAADRIRRIGQTKPCRVRIVVLAGTLDGAIVGVLRNKTLMIREVLQ